MSETSPRIEGPRAAHGEMDAPLALEEADEGVDRRGLERVAADEQRMEAEDLPELVALDVLGDHPVHGAVALQLHHLGHDLGHVPQLGERHVRELLEAHLKDVAAHVVEPLVAFDVARREPAHLLDHVVGVAGVVEHVAVVEADSIKRRDRPQVDIVRHLLAAQLPELLEQKRRGDHGGSAVELVAVHLVDVGAPARLVSLLEDGDLIPASTKSHGGGESAEPAPDDDGMRL